MAALKNQVLLNKVTNCVITAWLRGDCRNAVNDPHHEFYGYARLFDAILAKMTSLKKVRIEILTRRGLRVEDFESHCAAYTNLTCQKSITVRLNFPPYS